MTDDKPVMRPELWTPRPVSETIDVYAKWAASYDADVAARGYRTPDRICDALAAFVDTGTLILDYGCGTGISGAALRRAGYTQIHGTDITAEMLAIAEERGIYTKTWLSYPDDPQFGRGAYPVIVAVGVVSLGAAPAGTLGDLVAKLDTGGLLALSFNDPTLADDSYAAALDDAVAAGLVEVLFREHGPHLETSGMGSDVIVLRRL